MSDKSTVRKAVHIGDIPCKLAYKGMFTICSDLAEQG